MKDKLKYLIPIVVFLVVTLIFVLVKSNNYKSTTNLDNIYDIDEQLFGDTGILFNSNQVAYSGSSSGVSANIVQNAIDELYYAIINGCQVGYTKGTTNSTSYVCNKRSTPSSVSTVFESINTKYDNSNSGLSSTNVKAAIDELASQVSDCISGYHKDNATSSSYNCLINTQPSTLTVTNSTVSLTYNGSSSDNTYTYNGNGTVSCASSDTTKVTCTVDSANNKVTVSPVGATSTAVTITVSASQTANYYSPTPATFTVSVAPLEATFTCSDMTYNGTRSQAATSQTACTCTNCTLGTGCSAINAGSYTCNATANTNYTLSTTSIGWTMKKANGWLDFGGGWEVPSYAFGASWSGYAAMLVRGSGTISVSTNSTSYGRISINGYYNRGSQQLTDVRYYCLSKNGVLTITAAASDNYNARSYTINCSQNGVLISYNYMMTASGGYNATTAQLWSQIMINQQACAPTCGNRSSQWQCYFTECSNWPLT